MQKRVFVTAAAAGIGRAIARAFCADGARVHVCDIDAEALATLAEELPQLSYSVTDVGDEAQVAQFFRDGLEQLGGIDVLVNNAGIGGPAGPLETLDSTIQGLREGLAAIGFNDPAFRESRLMRLRALRALIDAGRLSADLRWTDHAD